MTAPVRIHRPRARGWKRPPDTVYIGCGTRFWNMPVCVPHNCRRKPCPCCWHDGETSSYCCVDTYREYILSGIENRPSYTGSFRYGFDAMDGYPYRAAIIKRLPKLRGKNLACRCPLDKPCPVDVLLEFANR